MSEELLAKSLGGNLYNKETLEDKLSKADSIEKVSFTAQIGSINTLFKAGDDCIIWGPASVEVVDKEGDLIEASALSDALPQLLRRARLSLEHSDQLVGEVLESFETEKDVTVEVAGTQFERSNFPTEVLELDGIEPALFVAGKVWEDSRQARETRRRIENGEIDSYSISGEALVTQTKMSDGETYDQVVDMDLSAVTLCEEGMNQKSKFGVVSSDSNKVEDIVRANNGSQEPIQAAKATTNNIAAAANNALNKNMSNSETEDGDKTASKGFDLEEIQAKFASVVDEKLPDGELATKDDVEDTVEDIIENTDRASEQDATDDEEQSPHDRYEDMENPTDREFSPATIERIADTVVDSLEEKYEFKGEDEEDEEEYEEEMGEEKEEDAREAAAILADEYDMRTGEVMDMLDAGRGDADKGEESDGEEAPDEEDEMPEMEGGEEEGEEEYTVEELEEKMPADVFDVASEYLEASSTSSSAEKSSSTTEDDSVTQGDIEKAVEDVLAGSGLTETQGVETGTQKQDPEPSFEKEDEGDTGSSHPALANIYNNKGA